MPKKSTALVKLSEAAPQIAHGDLLLFRRRGPRRELLGVPGRHGRSLPVSAAAGNAIVHHREGEYHADVASSPRHQTLLAESP